MLLIYYCIPENPVIVHYSVCIKEFLVTYILARGMPAHENPQVARNVPTKLSCKIYANVLIMQESCRTRCIILR
jgi:hypothetical protein